MLFIALFILEEMKHLLHVCSICNIHVLSSLWFKGISPNHCGSTIWLWCNFTLLSLVLFCLGLIEHFVSVIFTSHNFQKFCKHYFFKYFFFPLLSFCSIQNATHMNIILSNLWINPYLVFQSLLLFVLHFS